MKMTFKNIGPVSKAEMELKDLTIIAGANNTGKTYLSYTLYGFLKLAQQPLFLRHGIKDLPFDSDEAVQKMLNTGKAEIPIKNFDKMAEKVAKHIFSISADNISEIFSSPSKNFKGAEFSFYPDYFSQDKRENTITVKADGKNDFCISASYEKGILSFDLMNYEPQFLPSLFSKTILENMLIAVFIGLYVPKTFILSAERFGISLFYKELDFTKNRLVETLQKLKDKENKKDIDPFFLLMNQASSRYAQPIKDNIDYTRNLEFTQKKRSPIFDSKLFDDVKEMLDGYLKYGDSGIRFISKARKNGKFNIPLHLASSSVRDLSDFYFFLKHTAQKNQLLIIDEPESHLDTNNQIEMARLLARCVNSGLKVLITTHSDYLIKEFNNLIMLSNDFKGKTNFLKSNKEYTKKDYLKPESVGAYICENGTLNACEIDNKGMDIRSFDDTIDEINRISDELDFLTDSQ